MFFLFECNPCFDIALFERKIGKCKQNYAQTPEQAWCPKGICSSTDWLVAQMLQVKVAIDGQGKYELEAGKHFHFSVGSACFKLLTEVNQFWWLQYINSYYFILIQFLMKAYLHSIIFNRLLCNQLLHTIAVNAMAVTSYILSILFRTGFPLHSCPHWAIMLFFHLAIHLMVLITNTWISNLFSSHLGVDRKTTMPIMNAGFLGEGGDWGFAWAIVARLWPPHLWNMNIIILEFQWGRK